MSFAAHVRRAPAKIWDDQIGSYVTPLRTAEARLCLRDVLREIPRGEIAEAIGAALIECLGPELAHATAQKTERMIDRGMP